MFEVSDPHYVIEHSNGMFSDIYPPSGSPPIGLSRQKVIETKESEDVNIIKLDRASSPWGRDYDRKLIPKGKVWKFIFEVSHAPYYVTEHQNGMFSGAYARVENVDRDTSIPFGISHNEVLEKKRMDHVEVIELDQEDSPWDSGHFQEESNG